MPPSPIPATVPASPLNNGRRTLAMLSAEISADYMAGIVFGASDCALQHGYNMLSFVGGPIRNPNQIEAVRDHIFSTVDPALIDGVIAPLSSLARFITPEEIQTFFRVFRGKPIATIGMELDGAQLITADNETGMRQLLVHLIEDHGYRHIVFAMGSEAQPSATEKFNVYRQTLEDYGIPFDPRYVIYGSRDRNAPDWCTPILFDERKLEVDAIVSVNDNQAFCILHSLQERGIRVPEDIAVTGCMNVPDCSVSSPSLTTVQEPMYQLGWLAAKAVIDTLEGKPTQQHIKAGTKLIVRHSCGCTSAQIEKHQQKHTSHATNTRAVAQSKQAQITQIMREAGEAATQTLEAKIDEQDITRIASIFASVDTPANSAPALLALEEMIDQHLGDDVIIAWLAILHALHSYMLSSMPPHTSESDMASMDTRFESLTTLMSQKAFNYRMIDSETFVDAFRQIAAELKQDINLEKLRLLLVHEFKARDCFISAYADTYCRRISNMLAMRNGQIVSAGNEAGSYDAASIVPAHIAPYQEPYSLMVLPLTYGSEPIGMLVVDCFVNKGGVYENMVALASGALKNKIQIKALTEAEEKFTSIALAASDWLWEVDAHCRYTFCSAGVERVLGYPAESMIGRSLFEFVAPSESYYIELVRDYMVPFKLALSDLEHLNIHRDGHEVSLIISGQPIIKNERLIGYRGAFKDTTASHAREAQIRQLAYNDTLTGLANRTLFQDRLRMAVFSGQCSQQKFALLFMDLDRFKHVNDTLGHEAGDQLLKIVAERLSACVRESDTLARLGGDEFTAILTSLRQDDDVGIIAARMVNALSAPFELMGQRVFIGVSIGIANYPNDGDTALLLHKHADEAMYKAKEQGRNCYVFYDHSMGEKSARRLLLETALHQALTEELFTVQYQPQVVANNGEIVGAEALLRLSTPELGPISPLEFIGLAEEIGLIEDIGLWVFRTACQQARTWEEAGYKLRVAVNVSAKQFKNKQLAQAFIHIATTVGISPSLIEIEITENAVIENESTAREILEALSEFGFKIAIDDFGTGYSSLSSLKKFPIDTLKIDRSFIQDSVSNEDNANLVSAIVQIAKSLHLNVIAEGVETREQLELLQNLGCQEIQGYLFFTPLKPEQLDKWFRSRTSESDARSNTV